MHAAGMDIFSQLSEIILFFFFFRQTFLRVWNHANFSHPDVMQRILQGFQRVSCLMLTWLLLPGPQLESMMDQMRQEMENNPPLPGAYTPKRGDICAAKFSGDGQWCATSTSCCLILNSFGLFCFEQF